MPRLYSRFIIAFCLALLFFSAEGRAQNPMFTAREAEWQNYKLPASDFRRYTDPSNRLLFRAPADWTRQGDSLKFKGPEGVELNALIEEIPDGVAVKGYVAALMQSLRGVPGGADAITVRRTQMSGLEAREIMFELVDARQVTTRRLIWTAVEGPAAITFVFIAPLSKISQVEPYFKAIAQSAIIIKEPFPYIEYGAQRLNASIEDKPSPVDEVQSLVASVEGRDKASREKAVARLASIFATSPDVAIDLVLDRRAIVRAAAVEAIGLSGNRSLSGFLLNGLEDRDSFVAERAARGLARIPDAAGLIREERIDAQRAGFQQTMRAVAYLDEKARIEIVSELFKRGKEKQISIVKPVPRARRRAAPPPPRRNPVTPSPAMAEPGNEPDSPSKGGIAGGVPSSLFMDFLFQDEQFIAVNLLGDIPADRFKMPLAEIAAAQNQSVIVAALQIAFERHESLAVPALLKLLSSSSEDVRSLALLNLGQSAGPADIPRIQAGAKRVSNRARSSSTAEGIRVVIEKIRLREKIAAADKETRTRLIEDALVDANLADWVWSEFARGEIEGPDRWRDIAGASGESNKPPAHEVSPLGENLFPSDVTLYAALPNPSAAFGKLRDALAGIKMDSARGQATLVLLLNYFKETVAQFLEAQADGDILDQIGIQATRPAVFAAWTARGAPRGLAGAERKAILLRVSDRDRFEHLLSLYQSRLGNFASLPEIVSAGSRFIGFLPAILPVGGALALSGEIAKSKPPSVSQYYFIGHDRCLGYQVKVIERREVSPQGRIKNDAIYLAYAGDAAVLATDWYSLRDVLARLEGNQSGIAENPEFKRAVETGGDVIYLSNLSTLIRTVAAKKDAGGPGSAVMESGSLKISDATWENSYQVSFEEGWTRLLEPFKVDELSSPRELLPRSAVAYGFTKFDPAARWPEWAGTVMGEAGARQIEAVWALDFDREVLPEIGPEIGAALLGLPNLERGFFSAPWVIFLKLKSDKLVAAFQEGKLFKDVKTSAGVAHLRLGSTSLLLTLKNGYLVVSGSEEAIARLDEKERLDAARDFRRAAATAPAGVIAFGGYNLEAATAEIMARFDRPELKEFIKTITSTAEAFHSQNFYALPSETGINARMSVSLGREGRYSVAELSSLAKDYRITYAVIETRGVPIADQQRIENMKMRIRAKGAGVIDRIKEEVATPHQTAEKRSDSELIINVRPRRHTSAESVQLPVSGAEFAPFLQPTREIVSTDKNVVARAREIAGDDRDAWSVARKLGDWIYKNLEWKRVDDADAAQTLATREADCHEFSQLYVAMARALGLPARMVSGIAYGSGSFGGHAWVEVYAGEWIELDPTWGTDFVDATHIRGSEGELLSYAALNLIDVEVLEAPRSVPDFQRDPVTLAEKICNELPAGEQSALATALDIAVLTDEYMGAGTWAAMSEREREQMSDAYPRLLLEFLRGFKKNQFTGQSLRLLKTRVNGDRAETITILPTAFTQLMVRLKFRRTGDAWMLIEAVVEDTNLHLILENLYPAIRAILDKRDGKPFQPVAMTRFIGILMTVDADPAAALEMADQALKDDPQNRGLRHLKALALLGAEKDDEAMRLWRALSEEEPPFPPALRRLATHYETSKDEADKKLAIEFHERYIKLEPDDSRARTSLASLYRQIGEDHRAEVEYRAAIERDSKNTAVYIDMAQFLASERRFNDAITLMDEGAKYAKSDSDLFSNLLSHFYFNEKKDIVEALAASFPHRMAKSAMANYYLGRIRLESDRARESLPFFKKAIDLDKAQTYAHNAMADAYRRLHDWGSALASADEAIKLDQEDAQAHYNRACALARLGRKAEAIASLKRAVELDDEMAYGLTEEEDLKSLAAMEEFKNLIPKDEEKDRE